MQLTKEQKENLVSALKDYRKALVKVEAAGKEAQDKLARLKTCSQSNASGPLIIQESLAVLGEAYLEQDRAES